MAAWLTVVGIGEDGLAGLGDSARDAIAAAAVVFGGDRHLALLPVVAGQERCAWPSPFAGAMDLVLARRGNPVCILASGDPMLYGVGASLARRVAAEEMRVLPAPSAFSLAAARLGWPLQDVVALTVHGRPLEIVLARIHAGARLLVLSEDGRTPPRLARLLADRGFGASRLTVLEHMGGARERRLVGAAGAWPHDECADLNVVAVECRAEAGGGQAWSGIAGLPDQAYVHDGQLTKQDIRAVTLAHLAPLPGQLLWDVGAGCGSIGIEWMRSHAACRTIAIEAHAGRQDLIRHNSAALGVPGLVVVVGTAPAALAGLEAPDAVFIGGGLTAPGVVEACWQALKPGGRLVANAVTLQSEARLVSLRHSIGGALTRIALAHAAPLGSFDTWQAALPVTILVAAKAG